MLDGVINTSSKAGGASDTVTGTVAVLVVVVKPTPVPTAVTVITAEPGNTPVTTPAALTTATLVALEAKVSATPTAAEAGFAFGTSVVDCATVRFAVVGVTVRVPSAGGRAVTEIGADAC